VNFYFQYSVDKPSKVGFKRVHVSKHIIIYYIKHILISYIFNSYFAYEYRAVIKCIFSIS